MPSNDDPETHHTKHDIINEIAYDDIVSLGQYEIMSTTSSMMICESLARNADIIDSET